MIAAEEIFRSVGYLHADDATFELCAIGPDVKKHRLWGDEFAGGKKAIVAGWFTDQGKAAEIANALDAETRPEGLYVRGCPGTTTAQLCSVHSTGALCLPLKFGEQSRF